MYPISKNQSKVRNIKCLYTNANSLGNKRSELQGITIQHAPDVIGITEVWEKTEFALQGYHNAFRKDRAEGKVGGGGLLLISVAKFVELGVKDLRSFHAIRLV